MTIKNARLALSIPGLNPAQKVVLTTIALSETDKQAAFPSYRDIAEKCAISTRQAKRMVAALVYDNFLIKESNVRTNGSSTSNSYRINLTCLSKYPGDRARHPTVTDVVTHPSDIRGHPTVTDVVTPYRETREKIIEKNNSLDLHSIEEAPEKTKNEPCLIRKSKDVERDAIEVLDFLNELTDKSFIKAPSVIKPIINRLEEGVTIQQCRTVIARKHTDWIEMPTLKGFIRPSTIFKEENFYNYFAQCGFKLEDKGENNECM